MKYKTYTKVEASVGGNLYCVIHDTTLNHARIRIRELLDRDVIPVASIKAYLGDKVVKISAVRNTNNKHYPVCTATIG